MDIHHARRRVGPGRTGRPPPPGWEHGRTPGEPVRAHRGAAGERLDVQCGTGYDRRAGAGLRGQSTLQTRTGRAAPDRPVARSVGQMTASSIPRPKRVVLVVGQLHTGGTERQVLGLAQHLPDRGTDLHVVCASDRLKPFGFLDYISLQMNALCTISDSGTISEESSILSFPAISIRQSMERPEAQDSGVIILTGLNPSIVLDSIRISIAESKEELGSAIPIDYTITNTSWRVLKLILGNTGLSNLWYGIQSEVPL